MGTIQDVIRKFKNFQENIENLSSKTISIIPDAKGMIDRQCPREECKSYFKINAEDWKNIAKDEEVFCPFCRNNSKAQEYLPKEQRQAAVNSIRKIIMDDWHHGVSMLQSIASIESKEEFELSVQCENCNTRKISRKN